MQTYAQRRSNSGTIALVEVLRAPEGHAVIRRHLVNGRTFEWSAHDRTPEEWVKINSLTNRKQQWEFAA